MEAIIPPGDQSRRQARIIVGASAAISVLIALMMVVTTVLASDPVVTISMKANAFTPAEFTVNTGEKIQWLNDSSNPHTITDSAGSFHSGLIQAGNDYVRSFSSPGVISYYCTIHPGMTGTVTVLDTGVPPPATATPTTPAGSGGSGTSVTVFDNGYTPGTLSVPAGTTIVWNNTGSRPHTVTASNGAFTSGFLSAGAAYSRTFPAAGTFDYYCTIHPAMVATLVVTGGSPPPPAATPTPTPTKTPTSTSPPPTAAPGDEAVSIIDNDFAPLTLNITAGTKVTWTNDGVAPHTATARNSSFDSPILFSGDSFSFTFAAPGSFEYYCVVHPEMVATIVVTGGNTSPSTGPTATPTPRPSPTATPKPPPAGATPVEVIDYDYLPRTLTIKAGTTVTWTNTGVAPHTVTENGGAFDSGFMGTGATWSRTFNQPGRVSYYCVLHPGMVATVVVTDAAGVAPTPGPTTVAPALDPVAVPTVDGKVVRVIDNDYLPQSLTIETGTEVTWVNQGIAPHTATDRDGLFDSGIMGRGGVYSFTFKLAGTYEIFCVIHPDMVSSVTVKGGAAKPTAKPGTPTPTATPPPPPSPGSALMIDFDYTPKQLTVKAGASVTWTNVGRAPHTVTAYDDSFDSGLKSNGEKFTFTFKTPGTYGYYCTLHPDMVGRVVVTNAAGEAPPTPAGGSGLARPAPGAPSTPPPARANDVRMVDNDFAPVTFSVPAGSTVRWVNAGQVPHTASANDGTFDSGFVSAGGAFSFRFATPGTFDYTCIVHPGMNGRIVVTDALGQAPPPATPAIAARPDGDPEPSNNDDAGIGLEMVDFDYAPRDHSVKPGEEVLWINTGEAPHTVTARDGSFDSGIVLSGGEFRLVVDKPGVYDYYCTLHPQMVGTLTVSENAEGSDSDPEASAGGNAPGDGDNSAIDTGTTTGERGEGGALTIIFILSLLGIGVGGIGAVALPLMFASRSAAPR